MQLSLLGENSNANNWTKPQELRDYQVEISQQALSFLDQGLNPLTVAATGTGKTRIASAVVRAFPGRVLWIAHRIELVLQARAALEDMLGEGVDIELPGLYSANGRVVVASKDTVRTKSRLDRLKNFGSFDLIVIDECHHSEAKTYKVIVDAYPNARLYGLTATPGRLDRKHLSLFNANTKPFGIGLASEFGYLVPIRAERVSVKTVDLSGVSTKLGDLDRQQLAAIMRSEANLHAVAQAILDREGDLPGLLFSPAVDVAERTCEIINRYRPGMAMFVSGTTPDNERRELFANLGKTYQVLANYGIATEGTDLVCVRSVFLQRATKSPTLFQQMIGRGLRPLPGLVDSQPDDISRKARIAGSAKKHCLVVDFVGVTGKHSIQTPIDVLATGQDIPGQVVGRVRARLEKGEQLDVAGAITEELEAYRQRQEAKARRNLGRTGREAIVGKVQLSSRDIQLIGLGGMPDGLEAASIWDGPPLPGQVQTMQKLGISQDSVRTAREARSKIVAVSTRLGRATAKQLAFVKKHCPRQYQEDMSASKARYLIGRTIQGWQR